MGDFSEEMFLDYISAAGGKVKNADLLKTYKHFFNHNDKQLRAKYREEFKLIIDKIAVVKSENGEKYLVLKKKYKQLMLERRGGEERQVAERERESDNETQASLRGASGEVSSLPKAQADLHVPDSGQQLCPPTGAASSRTGEGTQANTPWCEAPVAMVTEVPEPTVTMQEIPSTLSVPNETTALQPEVAQNTTQMGEPGEDTGSKSDSEPEEEATGSMESPALALDPLEKEWMQSAAHGQLSNLSELLKQEPSLAHKKDFTSFTALHWGAKHGREDIISLMAKAGADINTKAGYTPLHIAALHGHRHIVDLLIGTYGAKESLRDYSGHLACQYLNIQDPPGGDNELQFHMAQAQERRNRKLSAFFYPKASGSTKKKWGSVEDLVPVTEEKGTPIRSFYLHLGPGSSPGRLR